MACGAGVPPAYALLRHWCLPRSPCTGNVCPLSAVPYPIACQLTVPASASLCSFLPLFDCCPACCASSAGGCPSLPCPWVPPASAHQHPGRPPVATHVHVTRPLTPLGCVALAGGHSRAPRLLPSAACVLPVPHYRLSLPSRPLPADLISPARPIHVELNPRPLLCGATRRASQPTALCSPRGPQRALLRRQPPNMQRCAAPGFLAKPPAVHTPSGTSACPPLGPPVWPVVVCSPALDPSPRRHQGPICYATNALPPPGEPSSFPNRCHTM